MIWLCLLGMWLSFAIIGNFLVWYAGYDIDLSDIIVTAILGPIGLLITAVVLGQGIVLWRGKK
jgi:hypothetical protein